MTQTQEREIGEAILRTRRWAFRDALPEILCAVRRAAAECESQTKERSRAADQMIRDYRRLICCASQ